jgi:hypothetical protein
MNFDSNRKSKVRFADHSSVLAEGAGNVVIHKDDGQTVVVEDVLYVPAMKCNLLSLGELLQKGFTITMKHNHLLIMDSNQHLILRAPLSKNRTFQANVKTTEVQCFKAGAANDDCWIWHSRYARSSEFQKFAAAEY